MNRKAKLRILLLAANPLGTRELRLGQEARMIKAAIDKRTKVSFDLQFYESVRSEELRFEVLSYRPHFVHFSGHGHGEAGIVLEDDIGATHLVTSEALGSFFEIFKNDVQCVFLNCCYSQPQAEAIAKHIPFVIGTRDSITDKAAIEFSVAFYEAIGQQAQISQAFQYGIAALKLKNLFSESKIPILVTASQNDPRVTEKLPQQGVTSRLSLLEPDEEKIIRTWILDDHCRLVLLQYPNNTVSIAGESSAIGGEAMRSAGLVARIAGELGIRNNFDCTVSANLDSAPQITQTLSRLLAALSSTRDIATTKPHKKQIDRLIEHLRNRRCLILLEGLDSLFDLETSEYLPGCAEYADFFKQISEVKHQSCVMVIGAIHVRDIALQSSHEQVRFIELHTIAKPSEAFTTWPVPLTKLSEPASTLSSHSRLQARSAFSARIKKRSQITLIRASERLPVRPGLGDADEARLDPIDRPETAPALPSFLTGSRPLLAIIGESGTGKTVLSHQIMTELPLALYYDTHHLETAGSLTETLIRDLGVAGHDLEEVFLNVASLLDPGERLVILVDAINEAVRIDPLAIKDEIESISNYFPDTLKLIYTCRKVYWDSHIQAQSPLLRKQYHDSSFFVLGDFSDGEARAAFKRYQDFFCFSGSYENLNEDLRRKVANPLMLRMLAEGYQGAELPSFAPAVQIFQRYYQSLQERLSGTVLLDFLTLLVRRKVLFLPSWEPDSDQFNSITIRTDPELATLARQQLAGRVKPGDPIILLEDEGILTPLDPAKRHYRFTYDRFYEYLLGIEIGDEFNLSSSTNFSQSLINLLTDFQARHFSYTQALKSEIVRQAILRPSSIWSFAHQDTLTSFIYSHDSKLVLFTKEVLRELLFESSSDVIGSLKAAFKKESSWLPIALDIVGDSSLHLLPLAVKGLFSGEANIARRSVHALISLLRDRDAKQKMEELLREQLQTTPSVNIAEAAGLFYYSAALVAQSEETGSDCLQEVGRFWGKILSWDKFKYQENLAILRSQFFRLVEEEGPNFFPSPTNLTAFDYLWNGMSSAVRQQALTLPTLLRAKKIPSSQYRTLEFFGSELKDWESRNNPHNASTFTYRLEYRLSQWILIYHSSLDYDSVRDILESFAASTYWLTIDFALCTMQFILLYVHFGNLAIVRDGFDRMQRWVTLLEKTEKFFDTFNWDDPFKATYNPLAQTATVDASFFSKGAQRIAFLDQWIGSAETRRCALGVLAARQLWEGFPQQVLASLRSAATRPETEIVDLLDRTLREIYYVYPRLVERALAQWGVSSQRAQSIRFRTDVPDPTGVEFRAEPLYKEFFLTTAERRLRTAAWYEQLLREPTLQSFCECLFDDLIRKSLHMGGTEL